MLPENALPENIFPERLKGLREKMGLTQEQLATELGLKKSTISRYEKGKVRPSMKTLGKIADYFGVSTDFLRGKSDKLYLPQGDIEEMEVLNYMKKKGLKPEEAIKRLEDYEDFQKIFLK